MPGTRRKARTIALKALYEVDLTGHPAHAALDSLLEGQLSEEAKAYARELVRGVLENKGRIDGIIARCAPAFPLNQVAVIDRNILRLAVHEALVARSAPVKVAINEAVELAKHFGSESSPRFVNGVLGSACLPGERG